VTRTGETTKKARSKRRTMEKKREEAASPPPVKLQQPIGSYIRDPPSCEPESKNKRSKKKKSPSHLWHLGRNSALGGGTRIMSPTVLPRESDCTRSDPTRRQIAEQEIQFHALPIDFYPLGRAPK
jgi:hypothetical protein